MGYPERKKKLLVRLSHRRDDIKRDLREAGWEER
jgi:hypothetical protein